VLGAMPFAKDVPGLAAEGVKAVVNTCREYAGPVEQYKKFGIEQLRVPTIDFTPPTLEHVEEAVAFMKRHSEAGDSIYVHCKAGRARSATVAVCWLVDCRGMTPRAAQDLLLQKRPHVNPRLLERKVVQQFCDKRGYPNAGEQ